MRNLFLGVTMLALVPHSAWAQNLDVLDQSINDRLAKSKAPGLSVAVMAPDGTIIERGYGVRNAESREPVVPGVLFRPGSATKMWTAAALLKAMEERKLSVHQPIGSFVKGLRPELARLTVHHLLSHTSGLGDSGSTSSLLDDRALADSVNDPARYLPFAEPGRIMSYSNPGYHLAGYVLEQVTGKPYADAIDALVLRPIGAERSTYRPMMAITYPVSVGHVVNANGIATVLRPMEHGARMAPSGHAFGTMSDMLRFARMILAGGKAPDGTQVLSPAIVAAMTTRHATLPESGGSTGYGYGIWLDVEKGAPIWHHGGGLDGFNTQVTMLPNLKVAVAAIANASDTIPLITDVINLVRAQVEPRPQPVAANGDGKAKPIKKPAALKPVPEPLASALVGRWGQGDYVFTVRRDGRNLTYSSGKSVLGNLYGGDGDRLKIIGPNGDLVGYVVIVRDAANKPAFMAWGARATAPLPDHPLSK